MIQMNVILIELNDINDELYMELNNIIHLLLDRVLDALFILSISVIIILFAISITTIICLVFRFMCKYDYDIFNVDEFDESFLTAFVISYEPSNNVQVLSNVIFFEALALYLYYEPVYTSICKEACDLIVRHKSTLSWNGINDCRYYETVIWFGSNFAAFGYILSLLLSIILN